jgi:hypothetical protein
MTTDYSEIVTLMGKYFDLLYKGDTGLINQVFLPDAHVYSLVDGQVVDVDMDQFHERIASRPSPESKGAARKDRILSIDISGPATALAKVDCLIHQGLYTDYLPLMKVGGTWRIIAKVFDMKAVG